MSTRRSLASYTALHQEKEAHDDYDNTSCYCSSHEETEDAKSKPSSILKKRLREERDKRRPPSKPKTSKRDAKKTTSVFTKTEKRVVCKYWMEGTCSKGDSCTYSHALTPLKSLSESKQPATLCKYILQAGSCARGSDCRFSHDVSQVPCKFWHGTGECAQGSECKFSHEPIAEEVKQKLIEQMQAMAETRRTLQTKLKNMQEDNDKDYLSYEMPRLYCIPQTVRELVVPQPLIP